MFTCDNEEKIKLFLAEPRVDPNIRDRRGNTPLHMATCPTHIDELLFDSRTDPNIRNSAAKRALDIHLENYKPDVDVIDLFLEHGAYTPADLDIIKKKVPRAWKRHRARFRETFEALDQGPLSGQASILSSLVAQVLYPGVNFLNM